MLPVNLVRGVMHGKHGELNPCFPEAIAAHTTSHHRQNQLLLARKTQQKTAVWCQKKGSIALHLMLGSWLRKRAVAGSLGFGCYRPLALKCCSGSWGQSCSNVFGHGQLFPTMALVQSLGEYEHVIPAQLLQFLKTLLKWVHCPSLLLPHCRELQQTK